MTLRERREAKGLTQQKVAELVGVAFTTYRMWEYGMPPNEENKRKLEEVLRDESKTA